MFRYYMPDFDLWTINYMVFENTFSGYFVTTPIRSFAFRPNVQETGTEKFLIICDSLVFVFSIIEVAICIFEIYLVLNAPKSNKNLSLMRIFKFPYILSYIIFFASLVVIIGISILKRYTAGFFDSTPPTANYMQLYDWYQAILYSQILIIICVTSLIFRWIKIFKWSRDMLYLLAKVLFCYNIIVNLPISCLLYLCLHPMLLFGTILACITRQLSL